MFFTTTYPMDASFPPEQLYASKEDLELDLDYYTAISSYKWIIQRSNYIAHSGQWKILYLCNQFRKGCQFSVNVADRNSGLWAIRHQTEARFHIEPYM